MGRRRVMDNGIDIRIVEIEIEHLLARFHDGCHGRRLRREQLRRRGHGRRLRTDRNRSARRCLNLPGLGNAGLGAGRTSHGTGSSALFQGGINGGRHRGFLRSRGDRRLCRRIRRQYGLHCPLPRLPEAGLIFPAVIHLHGYGRLGGDHVCLVLTWRSLGRGNSRLQGRFKNRRGDNRKLIAQVLVFRSARIRNGRAGGYILVIARFGSGRIPYGRFRNTPFRSKGKHPYSNEKHDDRDRNTMPPRC